MKEETQWRCHKWRKLFQNGASDMPEQLNSFNYSC